MGISLAELDAWNPNAVQAVFSAVTDHSASTRLTSDGLGQLINAVPWEGQAHDAAKAANTDIRRDLNLHAEELEAVAAAAKAAETEIRSIKSDWLHLQQEAAAAGMTINAQEGTVSYVPSPDPEEAAIQQHNYEVICAEVHRLLQRADQADADLAAAIDGADGRKSADEVNKQLSSHWIDDPAQAEADVHDALAGDKDAAARVNNVLDSITAEQQAGAVPLTAEQGSVLSQLQAQQNGMSIEALKTAEQRLGDQKDMIGNSWQLMSSGKLQYPKTELRPGAKDDPGTLMRGGADQLPTSVRQALESPGLLYTDQMNTIADIVKDGDDSFQHNTGVDQALLHKGSAMMDTPLWQQDPASNGRDGFGRDPALDPVVANVLSAAAPDHQVVHDVVTAPGGAGDRFLHNVTGHFWGDNGRAVSSLFDWTGPTAHGPEAQIAGETAHAYATYLGTHPADLLHMPGNHTLGEVNPELVRGMAHGLAPYVSNIAGEHNALTPFFPTPDDPTAQEKDFMSTAKGIFSVLSTDSQAAEFFDSKAYEEILRDQNSYAHDIANHVPGAVLNNAHMQEADTMRSLVDIGTNNALDAKGINTDASAAAAYASKSAAYDMAVDVLSAGADASPGGPGAALATETLGSALKGDIIGTPPVPTAEAAMYSNMTEYDADRAVLNGLHANGVRIDLPQEFFHEGRVASYSEYCRNWGTDSESTYNTRLRNALAVIVGPENVSTIGMEKDTYNNLIRNPHPWDPER